MLLELGEIIKSFWDKNGDAETKTQLFQTQLTEDDDTQVVEEMHIPGVQYKPPDNSRTFVARITRAFKIAVGVDDNVPKLETLNPGERISYASDSGSIVCKIHYKNDGTIQFDTDADLIVNTDGDLTATVLGATKLISTGDVDITAPNVNITGNLNVTGDIGANGDITADALATAITVLTHFHGGNLGFPTGAAIIAGGGTTPGALPSTNATGDIIDGATTNLSTHTHTQPNDAGGDAESPTSGPV